MAFIITISIIIYLINIAWTWKSLGDLSKSKKVTFIVIGLIAIYIITTIVFFISQNGVQYENEESIGTIKNVLVAIFAGINGIILLPQMAKILDKAKEGEIEKNQLRNRIILWLVVLLICLIFECGYMKDTQEGILEIYKSLKK